MFEGRVGARIEGINSVWHGGGVQRPHSPVLSRHDTLPPRRPMLYHGRSRGWRQRAIPARYRPVDYNHATINKFVSDKRRNRKGPYISKAHKATHGEQYFSTVAMRETGSNFTVSYAICEAIRLCRSSYEQCPTTFQLFIRLTGCPSYIPINTHSQIFYQPLAKCDFLRVPSLVTNNTDKTPSVRYFDPVREGALKQVGS